jgi:hypothetical protein
MEIYNATHTTGPRAKKLAQDLAEDDKHTVDGIRTCLAARYCRE